MTILYKEEVELPCQCLSLVVMVWCSVMMETVLWELAGRCSWLWTSTSTQWCQGDAPISGWRSSCYWADKRHEQSSWLSTEWRSSLWENCEVEEIGEDKEEEEKSLEKGCAGDEIVFGTHSLNELFGLNKDRQEDEHADISPEIAPIFLINPWLAGQCLFWERKSQENGFANLFKNTFDT